MKSILNNTKQDRHISFLNKTGIFVLLFVARYFNTKQDRHVYVYPLIHMKRNEL